MPDPLPTDKCLQVSRGEAAFHGAVHDALFNRLEPAQLPDAVVYPRTEADLVQIVNRARQNGDRLAIRSGGHSWVAASVRGDGTLVDLSEFDMVSIDTVARTASVGPAVRGQDLSKALAAVGLAFPVGHCGTPGVGGFLLAGGLGVNWGDWLPSCFSIRSMRVVLASGEVVTASTETNADLFWLARGTGPGFPGIVTDFTLDLRPLPADIRLSAWTFDIAHAGLVSAWVSRASARLPANVEVSLVLAGPERPAGPATPGGDPAAPQHVVGVVATTFTDTADEARLAFAAFDEGPGVAPFSHDDRMPVTFEELHVGVDATYPEGHRYLADTFWSPRDVAALLPPLVDVLRAAPSGKSYFLATMPGNGRGATLLPEGKASYGMHDTSLIVPYVIWGDAADDAVNRAWLNEVTSVLEPLSSGNVLSEADLRHSPERVQGSFRAEDWPRITELIECFDTEGVFHRFPTA